MIDLSRKIYQVYDRFNIKDEVQARLEVYEETLQNWQNEETNVLFSCLCNYFNYTIFMPIYHNTLTPVERAFFEGELNNEIEQEDSTLERMDAERVYGMLLRYDKADQVLSMLKDTDLCEKMINALNDQNRGVFCQMLRNCPERKLIDAFCSMLLVPMQIIPDLNNFNSELDLEEAIEDGVEKYPSPLTNMDLSNQELPSSKEDVLEYFLSQCGDYLASVVYSIYESTELCNDDEVRNIKRIIQRRDTQYDEYFLPIFEKAARKAKVGVGNMEEISENLIDHFRSIGSEAPSTPFHFPTPEFRAHRDKEMENNFEAQYKGLDIRNLFWETIYEQYGECFKMNGETITKAQFMYLFSLDKEIPQDYKLPVSWEGERGELIALLEFFYGTDIVRGSTVAWDKFCEAFQFKGKTIKWSENRSTYREKYISIIKQELEGIFKECQTKTTKHLKTPPSNNKQTEDPGGSTDARNDIDFRNLLNM